MNKENREMCLKLLEDTFFIFDNEEKVKFLNSLLSKYNNSVTSYGTFRQKVIVLHAVARFEAEANMKMAKMPPDMIDDFFYGYDTAELGTLKIYLSTIKAYLIESSDNNDVLDLGYMYIVDMKAQSLKKYVNTKAGLDKIITPKMLKKYAMKSINTDPCIMAATILIWEGIPVDKIPEIKSSDVIIDRDENLVRITVDGNVYTTEHVNLFELALIQNEYKDYDDEGNLVVTTLLNPDSRYFVKTNITSRDSGLEKITVVKMKKRIKTLAVFLGNKQYTAQNIIVAKKVYDLVKNFDFKKQNFATYKKYIETNNISFNVAKCNELTSQMLKKLKEEGTL